MFPKGKFNTNISRNALYMVLFRSPSDRKQMDMMAERTFAKDRSKFMSAYMKETEKPYGYIILDNHPKTASEKQVIANVFGDCYAYPNITKSTHTVPKITDVQPKPSVTCKVECPLPKQPVKRKTQCEKPRAKKKQTEAEPTMKQKKVKTLTKTQRVKTKQAVYKPKFMPTPPRESSKEEEEEEEEEEQIYSTEDQEIYSEEEQFYSNQQQPRDLMNELNSLARQSRNGFGPKIMHE